MVSDDGMVGPDTIDFVLMDLPEPGEKGDDYVFVDPPGDFL